MRVMRHLLTGRRHRPRGWYLVSTCAIVIVVCLAILAPALHKASGQPAHRRTVERAPAPALADSPSRWSASGMQRVVVLGDSVSAGTGCSCAPFVDLVAARLAAGLKHRVSSANLSVGGETSSQLVQLLNAEPTRQQLRDASLVLVMIGANDLEDLPTDSRCASLQPTCYSAAVSSMPGLISEALRQIKGSTVRPPLIVLIGYWNVFLDGAVARSHGPSYRANSKTLTDEVNSAIGAAANHEEALYVDTSVLFARAAGDDDTSLLAPDGDHPNALGQHVIADGVLGVLRGLGCPC